MLGSVFSLAHSQRIPVTLGGEFLSGCTMYGIDGLSFTLVWVWRERLEPKAVMWEQRELTGTSMCEHNPAQSLAFDSRPTSSALRNIPCHQNDMAC